ncbi:Transglycosylase associated protein [Botrimarina colliarenosi]|uniref:Transglycosylase associated protein n=1 Tax=Botrimarina colliarenosi TaxID=2528001 RepID=A0A5C6AM52_9BACT|nr:GlsB/YeaQ/YmgE family stress response membrane protein [Botrimarina colliarenosi]TWU00082.1 Transglycosylase associated protein [Botrimarina colliarenosi]
MFSLIWFLLIGLLAGWLATKFMEAGQAGVLGMMVVGVLGSFVGGLLFRLLGFEKVGFPATLVTATVGAVICIAAIRYFGPKF